MLALQQAIFNRMKRDADFLALMGLTSAVESEISKRILPTPPIRKTESPYIHFWFPVTHTSPNNSQWENRPIQFRIWSDDPALILQQQICEQLQKIFCNHALTIEGLGGYSKTFYVGEGQIPERQHELYGWFLEVKIQNQIKHFTEGG